MQASKAKLGNANQSIKIFAQFGILAASVNQPTEKHKTNLRLGSSHRA
jgi:hypothetical protein